MKIKLNGKSPAVGPDDPFYPWIAYQLGILTYEQACQHMIKQIRQKRASNTMETDQ